MASESDIDEDKVTRQMKARAIAIAFHGVGELDSRTAVALQTSGFMQRAQPNQLPADMAEFIQNENAQGRLASLPGPFIFKDEGDKRPVIDVVELLTYPEPAVRSAVVSHLRILASTNRMTKSTIYLLDQLEADIKSTDPSRWKKPAVALTNVLRDDVLLAAMGMAQCLQTQFTEGFNFFARRVMQPTFRFLESIRMEVWEPTHQSDLLAACVGKLISSTSTLEQACDRYYEELGHLPLLGRASFAKFVEEWLKDKAITVDLWASLWQWADRRPSPLPRYHVCALFLAKPGAIPQDGRTKLWSEIVNILQQDPKDDSLRWTDAWRLRYLLAQQFCSHFECLAPGQGGERIANAAWWLSERVASCFGDSPGTLGWLCEHLVQPNLARARIIAQLASPPIVSSSLRTATRISGALWARSLACSLNQDSVTESVAELQSKDRERITTAFRAALLDFSIGVERSGQPVYAFEQSVVQAARRWQTIENSSDVTKTLDTFIMMRDFLSQPLADTLKILTTSKEGIQMLAANAIRILVARNELNPDEFWKALVDDRLHSALIQDDEGVFGAILDCIGELQMRLGDKWINELPHFFAGQAEMANQDEQANLFAITFQLSASGGTTSAIDRLLKGQKKRAFEKVAKEWADVIRSVLPEANPWAAGRIRSLAVALRVD